MNWTEPSVQFFFPVQKANDNNHPNYDIRQMTMAFRHAKVLEISSGTGASHGISTLAPQKRRNVNSVCGQFHPVAGDPVLCQLFIYRVSVQVIVGK
jgi:hypothetical protein